MRTPSFPDPNTQRNRIPGQAELVRLKEFADSNAKVTRVLDEEIEQLHAKYDGIHARYIEQQLEMEATQSELHRARSLLSAAESQRAARQAEQDDLLALMHPVRRCPDDILREVFETVVLTIPQKNIALRQSVRLSSVCRRWRTVAIETPILWTKVCFNLSKPPPTLTHLQNAIVQRIKGRGAHILVGDIVRNSITTLETCGMGRFPVIETLTLQLATPSDFIQLQQPIYLRPASSARKVIIQYKLSMDNSTRAHFLPFMEGACVLAQLPNLTGAVINGVSNLGFHLTVIHSNIKDLTLNNVKFVAILTVLRHCPKLDTLKVTNSPLLIMEATPISMVTSSIKVLELFNTAGEDWMPHVTLNNLETLACTNATITLVSFLQRHRSVKKLLFQNPSDSLETLSRVSPQLVELHASLPLRYFFQPNTGNHPVAFPHLQHLTFISGSIQDLSMEEFDGFVRSRCLPIGHPKTLVKESSQIIPNVYFTYPPPNTRPTWYDSGLYKESTRSRHRHRNHKGDLLRLRWASEA